jgi:hypothetical protein
MESYTRLAESWFLSAYQMCIVNNIWNNIILFKRFVEELACRMFFFAITGITGKLG